MSLALGLRVLVAMGSDLTLHAGVMVSVALPSTLAIDSAGRFRSCFRPIAFDVALELGVLRKLALLIALALDGSPARGCPSDCPCP